MPAVPQSTTERPPEVEPLLGLTEVESEEEMEEVLDIQKVHFSTLYVITLKKT